MELEGERDAVLVEPVVHRRSPGKTIAAVGRGGVEEVYGVLYLDVGCDVFFSAGLTHHFSPLFTAIRRRPYQDPVTLSIPLPQDVASPEGH